MALLSSHFTHVALLLQTIDMQLRDLLLVVISTVCLRSAGMATVAPHATMDSLTTGGVILMDRQCLRMKDPLSMGLCLGAKTLSPYDHVGMVYKATPETVAAFPHIKRAIDSAGGLSPTGTYILEANVGGVTLRSMEARLGRTTSNEIAARSLEIPEEQALRVRSAMDEAVNDALLFSYKMNLIDFMAMSLKPPDKVDRMTATAKRIILEKEIELMNVELNRVPTDSRLDAASTRLLKKLVRDYSDAVAWLDKTYFPLGRHATTFVDGENNSGSVKGVFCSELIVHVWQRCGIVSMFPPSTSFAPVDFDKWDDEFSFTDERIGMGPHCVIYPAPRTTNTAERIHARDGLPPLPSTTGAAFLRDRLTVLRNMHCESNTGVESVDRLVAMRDDLASGRDSVLPLSWLVQSTSHYQLCRDMPERVMVVGALFSFAGITFAPWQLRSFEQQLGMSTVRGGLWSLSACLAGRSLTAAAVQAWLTYAFFRAYNKSQEDYKSSAKVMRSTNIAPLSSFADDRHPFYTCAAALIVCGAIAGSSTHVMESMAFVKHFGPDRPNSPSLRLLWRGVSMSCLCFTFSYGGAWLIWYECFGPLLFTTETSVFRKRWNQPRDDRWISQQRDAMLGAICVTSVVETVLYPFQAAARRRFLRRMYHPDEPPARRVGLWSGYGRHMARSLGICATTGVFVWNMLL